MTLPDWKNARMGSKKRVALWLVQEIGTGNVFTKSQVREAFPEVAQIDRRMRDLRSAGWQIDTKREDVELEANEQRFVRQGHPVWDGDPAPTGPPAPTANQRRDILRRDGHMCRSCGIGPGEEYPGGGRAQLDIARRTVRRQNGDEQIQMVSECSRCRVGNGSGSVDLPGFLAAVSALPPFEQRMFAAWVGTGSREFGTAEKLWASYSALPADARDEIRGALTTGS